MESDQKSFEDQKTRLILDYSAEKDRLHSEMRHKELDFERRSAEFLADKNDMIQHLKREFKDRIGIIENSNQVKIYTLFQCNLFKFSYKSKASLQSMRDQYEADFAIWKREHEASLKMREVERENTIRNQCRMERDRQIDGIVAKVDAEALKNQHEFEAKIM